MVGGGQADLLAAALVVARQADVVEVVVGEGKAGVAVDAAALAGEQLKAAISAGVRAPGVAGDPLVEARRRRDERALVGGQRLGDVARA